MNLNVTLPTAVLFIEGDWIFTDKGLPLMTQYLAVMLLAAC
jgi:hypothetical protein